MWLLAASLLYYSWGNPANLVLILTSILINFSVGRVLGDRSLSYRRTLLLCGILFNVGALSYYKYVDFFIQNINVIADMSIPFVNNELPLGISFFTFQQIAYLTDSYQYQTKEYSICNYALFVAFFPQLIAGPIVHHKEMMVQFQSGVQTKVNTSNVCNGMLLFAVGIFKKVFVADRLSIWASAGFASASQIGFVESWVTSLAYTFQLYFDFSGYCDMAVGLGWMFNIKLPFNFLAPYQAVNIQDFWRRWHITLGRFLRDYIYIPLGGSRVSEWRVYRNLLVVFVVGGIWHGAGWTFVFWGFLHGVGLVVHQIWRKRGFELSPMVGRATTFLFCNFAWVFFRAESWHQATALIGGMIGLRGLHLPVRFQQYFSSDVSWIEFDGVWQVLTDGNLSLVWIVVLLLVSCYAPNSSQIQTNFNYSKKTAFFASVLMTVSLLRLDRVSEFLYFNF